MPTGAITGYLDVAQLTLYAFWIFFAGLIWYLRREDKREGYPLISDHSDRTAVEGLPNVPAAKTFLLPHGGIRNAPRLREEPPLAAVPVAAWPGSPLEPTGDPMRDGVGAAAFANRADVEELTYEGEPRISPLRIAPLFLLEPTDPDPRGMTVIAADGVPAGVVVDVWIDRTEPQIRYLEVELAVPSADPRTVLLPVPFARKILGGRRQLVMVGAITAAQFADVPGLGHPDQVTMLEEDKIAAYFAGGYRYAMARRMGPVL
jgi:photosynthetic reaction center H subunit